MIGLSLCVLVKIFHSAFEITWHCFCMPLGPVVNVSLNCIPSLPSQFFYIWYVIVFCHKLFLTSILKLYSLLYFVLCWPVKCGLPQLWSTCFWSNAHCIPAGSAASVIALPTALMALMVTYIVACIIVYVSAILCLCLLVCLKILVFIFCFVWCLPYWNLSFTSDTM